MHAPSLRPKNPGQFAGFLAVTNQVLEPAQMPSAR
jgi:hypothetical protein